jgi:hypothetical protein
MDKMKNPFQYLKTEALKRAPLTISDRKREEKNDKKKVKNEALFLAKLKKQEKEFAFLLTLKNTRLNQIKVIRKNLEIMVLIESMAKVNKIKHDKLFKIKEEVKFCQDFTRLFYLNSLGQKIFNNHTIN